MTLIQNLMSRWFGIKEPVCGVRDAMHLTAEGPNRWASTHLKWFVESRPVGVGITVSTYDAEVTKAFAAWSAVSPLTFEQTNNRVLGNVLLRTARGPDYGFTGRTGPAANAFIPSNDHFAGQLYLTLNADKTWVIKQAGSGGIIILPILVHEIGHCLGLNHSTRDDQAMSNGAYYDKPQWEDIQKIQELYGVAPPPPPPAEQPFIRMSHLGKTYEGRLTATN